jgi:subtilisin-like proprotein convertase family protein
MKHFNVLLRVVFSFFIILFYAFPGFSQPAGSWWREIHATQLHPGELVQADLQLNHYRLLEMDMNILRRALEHAPAEQAPGETPLHLRLPLPNGEETLVEVRYAPVMMPALAARHPEMRSFTVRGVHDRAIGGRIGYTPQGFHAAVDSPEGTFYIDPVHDQTTTYYYAFYLKDLRAGTGDIPSLRCPVENPQTTSRERPQRVGAAAPRSADPVIMATYRFALTCTGEYAQFKGGTITGVLASYVRTMNRVNQILEQEVAIRLMLIDSTEDLIFLDPETDPYDIPDDAEALIYQNTGVINGLIGVDAYDIGHVFTRACNYGVGGIAITSSACRNDKGAGATCHATGNENFIAQRIMAHELGHQFSAGHSWNNCPGSLDQLSPGEAFEPGSGSTIMSYAGSCGNLNNVSATADDYYHVGSLEDIIFFSRETGGSRCATYFPTDNRTPTISLDYTNGFFIPIGTPFELTAQASDPDDDAITYCWEQYNLGPVSTMGDPIDDAPSFRSFPPVESPTRIFPRPLALLNNLDFPIEVLPAASRNLTFRCTVRDNNPLGGGVDWAEVSFQATEKAGPFELAEPASGDSVWRTGQFREVRWEVANTNKTPVNCQFVDIYLSLDRGQHFPLLLAENVPNTGSAFITVPDTVTINARLKVKAADNIFFDVSNSSFEIQASTAPAFTATASPRSITGHCLPGPVTFDLQVGSILGFDQPVMLGLTGDLPPEATVAFSKDVLSPLDQESAQLTIDLGTFLEGTFHLAVQFIVPGVDTSIRNIQFSTVSNDFSQLAVVNPIDGTGGIKLSTDFEWTDLANADFYDFELATNPAFGEKALLIRAENLSDPVFTPPFFFDENKLFYWRVRPVNECGAGAFLPPQTFHTASTSCDAFESTDVPVNISGTGRPTVESTIFIDQQGVINDLNIPNIKANYQPVKSLKMSLISPAGTEVVVYDRDCGNTVSFEAGFDDDAPSTIVCPPDDRIVFRPIGNLSDFIGESTFGTWILRVQVVEAGFGASGAIEAWSLEFCTDFHPNDPFLVTKDTLLVPPALTNPISNQLLVAEDEDNGPDQLEYTIVTLVEHGVLKLDADTLGVGDTFTQADIDLVRLRYTHDGSETERDSFTFLIQDGTGGWLPPQTFYIRVDEDAVTGIEELPPGLDLRLYPNPLGDELHLRFSEAPPGNLTVRIFNLQGQELLRRSFHRPATELSFDTSRLPGGVYFVGMQTGGALVTRKIIVARP